ncbi:hypothetical protein pb186bvf_006598 [Paramecium bursaria]
MRKMEFPKQLLLYSDNQFVNQILHLNSYQLLCTLSNILATKSILIYHKFSPQKYFFYLFSTLYYNNNYTILDSLLKFKLISKTSFNDIGEQKLELFIDRVVIKNCQSNESSNDQSSNILYIQQDRTILNDISGICPGGQITAILGASGAGKTSLLNVLACRIQNTEKVSLAGNLQANGVVYDFEKFQGFASYVMQNDILLETLTPREALTFVASFKYNDDQVIQRRVNETLKNMKLEGCQHTKIGGFIFKGLSGGERKRTSIGIELVSDPCCILLDEPTSGLDSFTAFYIINELQFLAKLQQRTIIFTIHQPSTDIFQMFDRIILLVQGKLIYQGPRQNIIQYFSSIGFQCPGSSNPMDYFLSIMHSDNETNQKNFGTYFSQYDKLIGPIVEEEIKNMNKSDINEKKVHLSQLHQIKLIGMRELTNFQRSPLLFFTRIFQAIFLGVAYGGIFYGVGDNPGSQNDLFYLAGPFFFITMSQMFIAVYQYELGFILERDVFIREENSKLYTTASYFLGKQFVDIPFCFVCPIIQCLITYGMMALSVDLPEQIPIHLITHILLFMCSNSIGLMVGCLFEDFVLAINTSLMYLMPFLTFAGFLALPSQYYGWIEWFQYLSPQKFAFEALVTNEVKSRHYQIDPLEFYKLHLGVGPCLAALLGYFFLYRFIAYFLLLKLRTRQQ